MNKLTKICCLLFFLHWSAVYALVPSKAETKSFEKWFAAAFISADKVPLFSFTYQGRSSDTFIKTWKRTITSQSLDEKKVQWTVHYDEPDGLLRVSCTAIVYKDFPAVDWQLNLSNRGKVDSPILEAIRPLNLVWRPQGDTPFVLHHSKGEFNSAASFEPVERVVPPDSMLLFQPIGGRSSDGCMPFFNLNNKNQGVVMAIGWTGQWQASFANISGYSMRMAAGMEWTYLKLLPLESIRTPRIVLLFWQGADDLRGNNLFRQLLMEHYMPRRNGQLVFTPICGSIDVVDPDGSYEGPHVRTMPALAQRGMEAFWSDMDPQHWYPLGFPDGTGTWLPDPIKYPHGLAPIGEAARRNGLDYLLWFEPERVAPGSNIDRIHPEWIMAVPDQRYRLFKLHDATARAWLTDHIDQQIASAGLAWLRWDFNIEPLKFWQLADAPDRQGITEIRYIDGLYAMWDELMRRHPGMIIDVCASGGRRLDIETYKRGLPLWHSDMQCFGPNPEGEQLQNGGLYRWLPMHACGAFGYEPSYQFRSGMTGGNILLGCSKEWLTRKQQEQEKLYLQKLGVHMTPWFVIGPFTNPDGTVFTYSFAPEIKIDLEERFNNGTLAWKLSPEWKDGEAHFFEEKIEGAHYLYRTIYSPRAQTITAFLGSDDAIHVWLDNKLTFVRFIDRAVTQGTDTTLLNLHQGENTLLMKITNKKGRSGFYFSTIAHDPRSGCLDTAFPETEQEVKRTVALYKKIRPFMFGDFYPLFPHDAQKTAWYGYQFHRPDHKDGVIILFRRAKAEEINQVTLQGIQATDRLLLSSENANEIRECLGSSLKVTIAEAPGSEILFYQIKR